MPSSVAGGDTTVNKIKAHPPETYIALTLITELN